MEGWCDIKFKGMIRSAPDEEGEMVIFGRRLRWDESWLEYDADLTQKGLSLNDFGLDCGVWLACASEREGGT